jgi:hypothetical protein
VSRPAISVILASTADAERFRPTVDSVLQQSLDAEIIGVVPFETRDALRDLLPEIAIAVGVRAADWTRGRALNAGAGAASAPIHATVDVGRALPRVDWLERVIAHHRRPEVVGASGARYDQERRPLVEARDVRAADWTPEWCFSASAAGWRATAWASCPFPAGTTAAEDRIWAWWVLRDGSRLVVDPFLQLEGRPDNRPTARSIMRATAADWHGLVSAGTPVSAPSLRDALASWWNEVDSGSATPAALQRLNYYRLSRALGRWAGGRRALRRRR